MNNRRTPTHKAKVGRRDVPPQPRFIPNPAPPPRNVSPRPVPDAPESRVPPATARAAATTVTIAVARPYVPAPPAPRQAPAPPPLTPVRPIIGDELRIPMVWCELGLCINRCSDPDALGIRDLRDKALRAGWRYDALGRLACPSCVQGNSDFRLSRPPIPVPRPR
jgi:hypothetical protein